MDQALKRTGREICSPNKELFDAVKGNDITKIKNLIKKNKNLLKFTYTEYNKTILLVACSENNVNAETVQELLSGGANLRDYSEYGWKALHFAASKMNYDILDVLLKKDPELVNVIDKNHCNALHVLIRCGDKENTTFLKCAKLLIQMGVDVYFEDLNGKTPLNAAVENDVSEEIRKIIDDSGKKNTSQQVIKNNTPAGKAQVLKTHIKHNNKEKFTSFKDIKDLVNYDDGDCTLLQMCCIIDRPEFAKYLLSKGADVNKITKGNRKKPIQIAAEKGCSEMFQILLDQYDNVLEIPTGILGILLKHIDRKEHDNLGCYNYLVTKLETANNPDKESLKVNETKTETDNDSLNNTPLHYAVRKIIDVYYESLSSTKTVYADEKVTEKLLSLGASLGAKNRYGVMPVHSIEPETLKNHLDQCVMFDLKEEQMEKEGFQVKFNYRSLIPPYLKLKITEESKVDVDNDIELAENRPLYQQSPPTLQKALVAETEAIYSMSKASEYKHLMKHPVIVSFLFMKWKRIQWLFWVNLAFYLIFALSLVIYIFTDYAYFSTKEKSTIHNIFVQISYTLLGITLIALILRELFQICVAPKKYFKKFENYMEILLIILTAMIVFMSVSSPDTRKQLSSLSILLAALELILMLGNHPWCSTNVIMLKTVSFDFFKFLLWYSLLIVAFAISFYLLFTSDTIKTQIYGYNNTAVSGLTNLNISNYKDDNYFDNPGTSVFKTIIMLTGEFNSSDLNFDTFPITSKIIFVLFVFMIAIILLNLLNGLAVSDTQLIKKDAELVGHIARAKHIRYVESMLMGNLLPANLIKKLSNICSCLPFQNKWTYRILKLLAKDVSLFPKYLNYELIFYPNQNGLIDLKNNDQETSSKQKGCTFCSGIYLDPDIVTKTNKIIRNRKSSIRKENGLESLNQKMDKIMEILLNAKKENFKEVAMCDN